MASKPIVSVVLPVYNGEPFVAQAIDSILNQTFAGFELITINDGSTDGTLDTLKSYDDQRLRIISQKNKGLVASLNRGIQEARGEYIARQDADDASDPARLEKQIALFRQDPDIVLAGSSMKVMDAGGKITHSHYVLLKDPELRQELLVRSPFAHGSVMFRKDAAIKASLYDERYWPAEDYELWLRLSLEGKLANIDTPLYIYRENSEGISLRNQALQDKKTAEIRELAWKRRKSLLTGRTIRLKAYKRLPDGNARIERILKNVLFAAGTAKQRGAPADAMRAMLPMRGQPQAYKKLLGKLKRAYKR